jgi:hypothetical protein
MWGVTFADLRYRYRQFLIAVVGAGLVLAMALLISGLVEGSPPRLRGWWVEWVPNDGYSRKTPTGVSPERKSSPRPKRPRSLVLPA